MTTDVRATSILAVLLATVVSLAAEQPWTCTTPPVEPCAKRRGRLSSQNGIPLRLWLIGTKRVVAPANDVDALPSEVRRYLEMTSEDHGYIFGDFVVCPLEPDLPGQMRRVCVTGAEKLVVQPLRRPGPPFRILSTWSAQDRAPGSSQHRHPVRDDEAGMTNGRR
jgi:hypothetical protein